MKLRVSTLTPFFLAALARGQIVPNGSGGASSSSKDLATIPRPNAPLPVVPCEGALKEEYDAYLEDWPEKEYGVEVSCVVFGGCVCWVDWLIRSIRR